MLVVILAGGPLPRFNFLTNNIKMAEGSNMPFILGGVLLLSLCSSVGLYAANVFPSSNSSSTSPVPAVPSPVPVPAKLPSSDYKSDPAKYGDIYGFDVSSPAKFTGKANLDDCAQACNDTPDCKSFVLDTADPAKPTCWGKTINDLGKSYPIDKRALYYKS
jgi:hypothetical protein